jgi:membrane-associated phospholipid phosphatase
MFRKPWTRAVRRLRQPAARPLLAPAARRLAAGLVALCVVITVVLGAQFAHQGRPGSLDRAVDSWLRAGLGHHPGLLNAGAWIGDAVPVTLITVALVLACLVARRWRGAALVAVAEPVAAALTEFVLKPLIHRTLQGALSLPSGHSTRMFALAGAGLILLAGPSRPRMPAAWRVLLVLAGYLIATAVAVAMVGMGAHYFTDTVAGAAVGTAVVLVTAFLLDRLGQPEQQPRPFPVRPPAPERAVRR